jgi:rhodanese-related sulfurtransferase
MKNKPIILIFICAVFLYSCGANTTDTDENLVSSLFDSSFEPDTLPEITVEPIYRKITASEAREMMELTNGFTLLDVRTEEEFREQRINGAILIPDFEISERVGAELPDKNALILVYCRAGRRSENAARELVGLGYTNVYDFGGILDWGYETVSG